jgi:hypothetical protein
MVEGSRPTEGARAARHASVSGDTLGTLAPDERQERRDALDARLLVAGVSRVVNETLAGVLKR